MVDEGRSGYARSDLGRGEHVQIEFISANPTGPLHVGNGWWGAYGDAMGRVMTAVAGACCREYYVNDTGGQIRVLGGASSPGAAARRCPKAGYQGEYVTELAAALRRARR